jgi:hypothetical protein
MRQSIFFMMYLLNLLWGISRSRPRDSYDLIGLLEFRVPRDESHYLIPKV